MEEKVYILIVDDDEDTCWNLAQVFGKMGYETETARTGEEALEKARGRPFNVALVDIRLPDIEGIELLAPLKEMHPDTALIIVTGYASVKTAVRALNTGAAGYITKPLNMDEVLTTVREALEKQCLVMENRRLYQAAQQELAEREKAEEALKAANQQLTASEQELRKQREHLKETIKERTKELRDAQEELIRKEKLTMLGQLAGSVGHELRNPLGVISNAIYYLKTMLPDADETIKEYLDMITSEVKNSERIVTDLLGFSRIQPADKEKIALSELVDQALDKQPSPDNVKVTKEIASDLPLVFIDPRQIDQVLFNLIINAFQAMPDGGKLTISAQAEKEKVSLSITDTGCGVSRENMKNIFEPLFTTKARGIGLGLAVSKSLVEANGGSIEVESEEGRGSTFTLILPTREAVS